MVNYKVPVLGKMIPCLRAKKHESDQNFFTKNGGALLEELIAFSNGRSNPIRHFSAEELLRATNYYDERCVFKYDAGYKMYKGSLKDYPIIVKKYETNPRLEYGPANPYKDIVIGSQMSAHKNGLKVLGCCLETQKPIIVYEFAGTKSLHSCFSPNNVEPQPLKCRLKIAMKLAKAVAYLHTAFSRPVIHRDIKSSSIILDQNNVPKLIDFGLCISIPEGKSHIEVDSIVGRTGLLAPEWFHTCPYITEKVDVYQFGHLLFVLLTGKEIRFKLDIELCAEKLTNEVYSIISNEGIALEQSLDFATLLLGCLSEDEKKRLTMIEVAKELKRIDQSLPSACIISR